MNIPEEDIKELGTLTVRHIGENDLLDASTLPASGNELRNKVRIIVSYLLDKDMERLLSILYRVDVSENKVKEAMIPTGDISGRITDLILHRLMEKVETRRKYS